MVHCNLDRFMMKKLIKLTFLALGFLFLGSCASVKNPQFLKSSLTTAEEMPYVQSGTDFFKEPDWKMRKLKGKVRKLTESTQVLDKDLAKQTENPYDAYDRQTLFDRMGNYVESFSLRENNRLSTRWIYKYIPKERTVESEVSIEGRRGSWVYYDSYNPSKQKHKAVYLYTADILIDKTVFQLHYDDKNRVILSESFQSEVLVGSRTYKYDDEKNTKEEIFWGFEGNQISKRIHEYNDNGDVVRDYYISKGQTYDFTIEYEIFDDLGNWTQRRVLAKGNPVYLIKRTFEYYE